MTPVQTLLVALGLALALLAVVALAGGPADGAGGAADDTADGTADGTADDAEEDAEEDAGAAGDPAPPAPVAFPDPPAVPDGALARADADAVAALVADPQLPDRQAIAALGASGDPRLLWILSDVLRLARDADVYADATAAAASLSGLDLTDPERPSWVDLTDHLIAWDLPAPDGYVAAKAALFTAIEPAWQPFFDDADADIDWRLVSWGGVLIDDRRLGDTQPCLRGCIPALDDPVLVPAADGAYHPDDRIVFGIRVGEEAVALPRNAMEVHEMVNATIGGTRLAIPYCTLCGAAQAFVTDGVGDPGGDGVVMRTSGLLHRSNKVMYDLTTGSVFDTFTGVAVSGPLQDAGVVLPQVTVVTSTWGDWRAAHPDTRILAEDGGIGRRYPDDPLRGRDDDGPIFPIGDRDPRLGVQEPVVGVVLGDGTPLAFPAAAARAALEAGAAVELGGVVLRADGGGLVAEVDGQPFPSHQAFWFAWSQFHPDTLLWAP